MANFQVSKEYVRGQLVSMGIQNISEEDLEAYTRDFSRLVEGHLEQDDPISSAGSDSETSHETGPEKRYQPRTHGAPSSAHSSTQHTPVHASFALQQPGSAVFKTFPGDKENRVQFLSPSLSPRLSPASKIPTADHPAPNSSLLSSASSTGSAGQASGRRRTTRRKVLRRCNGESKVFNESISDYGSVIESPHGGGIGDLSGQLSDLSIASGSSSLLTAGSGVGADGGDREGTKRHEEASYRAHCCRSFIRPPLSHPHTRGLKKSDPVTRYHEFRQAWETHKAPGEKSRNSLRWHIREQLTHQDVPYYEPRRQIHKPNNFVVPTDKKRSELRWEIKHTLAHQ